MEPKLDESFLSLMADNWSKVYKSYYETKINSNSRLLKWKILLTKFSLKYYSMLAGIDLNKDDIFYSSIEKKIYPNFYDNRITRSPLIVKILRLLFIIFLILISINCVYQYKYETSIYEYEYYSNLYLNNSDDNKVLINLQRSKEKFNYYYDVMNLIGGPYRDLYSIVPSFFGFLVWISIVSYISTYLYTYFKPLDFGVFNFVYNGDKFLFYYVKLVHDEINSFIDSGSNCLLDGPSYYNKLNRLILQLSRRNQIDNLNRLNNSIKQLKELALECYLIPLNKRPSWIISEINIISTLILNVITSYFWLFFSFSLSCHITSKCHSNYMDIMVFIMYIMVVGMVSIVGSYFFTLNIITALEYIWLSTELAKTIQNCVKFNSFQLHKLNLLLLKSNTISSILVDKENPIIAMNRNIKHYYDIISKQNELRSILDDNVFETISNLKSKQSDLLNLNRNLLYVYVQYKLYCSQLTKSKKTFQFIGNCTIYIVLIGPLFVAIELPYYDQHLKIIITVTVISFIVLLDITLLPICYLIGKSALLCKSLYNLIAHNAEVEYLYENVSIYDHNLISLLRKEVLQMNMLDRFTFKILGFPINYLILLRIHLWLAIIVTYAINKVANTAKDSY